MAKGPAGRALVDLAKTKRCIKCLRKSSSDNAGFLITNCLSYRYLTPPSTSTAVERLFSAAGLIMESKRNKLSPQFVDKLLFLREAYLLGLCDLAWK